MPSKSKKIELPFHIVLLGQIASGKDTQAAFLQTMYAVKPVESGKYWRALQKSNTKEGEMLRKTTLLGKPAPVVLMKSFLSSHIEKLPKKKTLLFVGNPRLKPEAQLLDKLFKNQNQTYVVFYIALPDKEVLKRSFARVRNADDTVYIKRRIAWHKEQVSKTVTYFQQKPYFAKINGNQSIEKVHFDIQKNLYAFLAKMSKS